MNYQEIIGQYCFLMETLKHRSGYVRYITENAAPPTGPVSRGSAASVERASSGESIC
jgi:hypothetical protein